MEQIVQWLEKWADLLTLIISAGSLVAVVTGFWFTKRALDYNAHSLERSNASAIAANYHNAIEFQKDTWLALLQADVDSEEMLKWHLEKRGLPTRTHVENKKVLFYLLRLDVYEELLLAHKNDLIDNETIKGWINAIRRDAKDAEFVVIWEEIAEFYADVLQNEVNAEILLQPTSEVGA